MTSWRGNVQKFVEKLVAIRGSGMRVEQQRNEETKFRWDNYRNIRFCGFGSIFGMRLPHLTYGKETPHVAGRPVRPCGGGGGVAGGGAKRRQFPPAGRAGVGRAFWGLRGQNLSAQ